MSGEKWLCPVCNEPAAWWNLVNVTNGAYCSCGDECEYCESGRIDGYIELEIDKEAVVEICNLGHKHVVEEATYKIPRKGR